MKFRYYFTAAVLFGLTAFVLGNLSAQEINSPIGAKHVIFIGYDGFSSTDIHWDDLPNLSRMRDNGAWTLHKRAVLPSVSAINWVTILMGAGSELHGFRTWGSKEPDLPSAYLTENGLFPDIFYLTRKAYPESKLYVAYSLWDGIGYLYDTKAVNDSAFVETDEAVCAKGLDYMAENPTLEFIYFSEPDTIGHSTGWYTPQYYEMMKTLDGYLGQLLDYLENNDRLKDTVVVFTSDHGGIEQKHGGETMEEMESPFMILGCGVKPGEITDVVGGYDVGATILWILGIDQPQCWRGKAITSAFEK